MSIDCCGGKILRVSNSNGLATAGSKGFKDALNGGQFKLLTGVDSLDFGIFIRWEGCLDRVANYPELFKRKADGFEEVVLN